jgi:hypothetical protein
MVLINAKQNQMGNQEWAIKNGKSRIGNQEWEIKNGKYYIMITQTQTYIPAEKTYN